MANKVEVTADPEKIREYERLKRELGRRKAERPSRWYCGRPGCDGLPHEGMWFCDHPAPHPVGPEFWRCRHARADQCPPAGDWHVWLLMSGRGFGKTRSGAEWLAYGALHSPGTVWAAVAPTRDDLRATCIEGESGLLAALGMTRGDDNYDKSNLQIRLSNGSLIRGLSAERPERTRGPNLAGMWADELCVWRYPSIWNDLTPALRRGEARIVVSTTPRPTALIRTLVEDETTVVTRGSTFDNEANLSTVVLSKLRQSWEGTRLSRQELFGELLTDTPGAVFNAEWIERGRGELLAA